jgi:Protein of unknown function (DUF2846)
MTRLWMTLVLFAGLAICGCQATGEPFSRQTSIPAGKGLVYVYRMAHYGGSVRKPDIYINKTNVGPLPMDGFMNMTANPGPLYVQARLKMDRPDIHVNIQPGKTSYVRLQMGIAGFTMREVNEQEALVELAKCRQQPMESNAQ